MKEWIEICVVAAHYDPLGGSVADTLMISRMMLILAPSGLLIISIDLIEPDRSVDFIHTSI
ncbi:MAG: hypothetical protein L0220_17040 [Acidobacteria bacterium]|nr:hypothetical protein [Acidobacteriota bacterium]